MQGAIFDVDGTLLDSMPIWMVAGERYLARKALKAEEGLGDTLFAMTMGESAEYLKETYGISDTLPEIIEDIRDVVRDFYRKEAQLKPGVREMLSWLKAQGIPMAVATSSERFLVESAFERLGVLSYFQGIFTSAETGVGKHSPLIFQQAAACLGSETEETWVFEDGLYALRTANAAGFVTVGLYDAASPKQQKSLQREAAHYGKDMGEILALLKEGGKI